MPFGWIFRWILSWIWKETEEEGKEKELQNNKERGRQSQQEIDRDTSSSIVTSGDGPKNKTPLGNSPTKGPSQNRDPKTKMTSAQEELVDRRQKREHDNSSTSNSDSSDDNPLHYLNELDKIGAHSSSDGNQGKGGPMTHITGRNVLIGKKNTIIKNINKVERSHEKGVKPEDKTRHLPTQNENKHLGNFRKIIDETDTIYNLQMIVHVAKSVGIIRSPDYLGTGFRVGDSYIMTARHVVIGIINSAPVRLEQPKKDGMKILGNSDVYIDFDFELPQDSFTQVHRHALRFNFEPNIYYENEALDTAVLKLKPNNLGTASEFPPKLIQFAESGNIPFYFVGHNNGKVKQFDRSVPKDKLMEEDYKQLQQWSSQHPVGSQTQYQGYSGADNNSKILFDCTFNKGASGSPGFIIHKDGNVPYVVTMLLQGYPDWFYDETVPLKNRSNIPPQKIFEQGVRMTEICFDMRIRKPDMAENIFGPKPEN